MIFSYHTFQIGTRHGPIQLDAWPRVSIGEYTLCRRHEQLACAEDYSASGKDDGHTLIRRRRRTSRRLQLQRFLGDRLHFCSRIEDWEILPARPKLVQVAIVRAIHIA